MKTPELISKYLKKQDLSCWKIELNNSIKYNNIIVVPALDELQNIITLLNSLSKNSSKYLKKTLIVIVVNNTFSESEIIIEQNRMLISHLQKHIKNNFPLNLGFIDASTFGKALPDKIGGVGIARKIGMDISLNYFDFGNNRKKIFISLDADCLVSNNYLETIIERFNKENLNAAIINYNHLLPVNENEKAAIINYEIFLRYYVMGLKYANSPFAFHSIGSTMAFDVEGYLKVGGMNKKKAGEDFYFLEKLAKNYDVVQIRDTMVFPSPRVSSRVPFGTGPRVKRFLENSKDEYQLYSPISFEILKSWLEIFSDSELNRDSTVLLSKAQEINKLLFDFLVREKFEETWNKIIENSKTEMQLKRQQINWMDGFKTLKLVHYLRDNGLANENMFSAINDLLHKFEINHNLLFPEKIPPTKIQQQYLELLRSAT
jgi:hypothetical protein